MAETAGVIGIRQVVDNFIFKYKLPSDDASLYFEHACNCYRNLRVKHGSGVTTEEVTVDANGIITMPSSLISFIRLGVYRNDELWSFTERPLMDRTVDSPANPPEILDNLKASYGAKGAVNKYYYAIDWDGRRIFCEGICSDTAIIQYVGSGIDTTADTLIPELAVDVIEAYLLWKKGFWDGSTRGVMADRKQDYNEQVEEYRSVVFSLTEDQLLDIIWGTSTQGPKR